MSSMCEVNQSSMRRWCAQFLCSVSMANVWQCALNTPPSHGGLIYPTHTTAMGIKVEH